jgi:hypothetical protein
LSGREVGGMTVSLLWYDLGFLGWNSTCLGRPCLERIVAAYKYGRRWVEDLRFTSATRVLLALLPWRISPAPDLVHPQSRHRQRRHFGPDDQTGSRTLFYPGSTKLPGVASKHPTLSAFPGCPRSVEEIDGMGTGTRGGNPMDLGVSLLVPNATLCPRC